MTPVLAVVAFRFRVDPLQSGPLFEADGVAGGFGSVRLNGPTELDGHPLLVAVMLEYEPAAKLPMIMFPEMLATKFMLTGPEGPVY